LVKAIERDASHRKQIYDAAEKRCRRLIAFLFSQIAAARAPIAPRRHTSEHRLFREKSDGATHPARSFEATRKLRDAITANVPALSTGWRVQDLLCGMC
jgi:hypothetical protein